MLGSWKEAARGSPVRRVCAPLGGSKAIPIVAPPARARAGTGAAREEPPAVVVPSSPAMTAGAGEVVAATDEQRDGATGKAERGGDSRPLVPFFSTSPCASEGDGSAVKITAPPSNGATTHDATRAGVVVATHTFADAARKAASPPPPSPQAEPSSNATGEDDSSLMDSLQELEYLRGLAEQHPPPAPAKNPGLRKTQLCRHFANGLCLHGSRCNFAHGEEELKPRENEPQQQPFAQTEQQQLQHTSQHRLSAPSPLLRRPPLRPPLAALTSRMQTAQMPPPGFTGADVGDQNYQARSNFDVQPPLPPYPPPHAYHQQQERAEQPLFQSVVSSGQSGANATAQPFFARANARGHDEAHDGLTSTALKHVDSVGGWHGSDSARASSGHKGLTNAMSADGFKPAAGLQPHPSAFAAPRASVAPRSQALLGHTRSVTPPVILPTGLLEGCASAVESIAEKTASQSDVMAEPSYLADLKQAAAALTRLSVVLGDGCQQGQAQPQLPSQAMAHDQAPHGPLARQTSTQRLVPSVGEATPTPMAPNVDVNFRRTTTAPPTVRSGSETEGSTNGLPAAPQLASVSGRATSKDIGDSTDLLPFARTVNENHCALLTPWGTSQGLLSTPSGQVESGSASFYSRLFSAPSPSSSSSSQYCSPRGAPSLVNVPGAGFENSSGLQTTRPFLSQRASASVPTTEGLAAGCRSGPGGADARKLSTRASVVASAALPSASRQRCEVCFGPSAPELTRTELAQHLQGRRHRENVQV